MKKATNQKAVLRIWNLNWLLCTDKKKIYFHTRLFFNRHFLVFKIAWIRSHHLNLQWKFKLWVEKFACGIKAKHCWALSTNLLFLKACRQANFPVNNLNFHLRWRWWDRIQAIFLKFFYFTWNTNDIQVILFEITCAIFYTNLHELFCQFISWTNWVNSGKFIDSCWISCQVMADMKKVFDDLVIINL